jgi:toxin ParE1/3/4
LKSLRWRPLAREDRLRIMEYIARDNPTAAVALDSAFEAEAQGAQRAPTLYRPGRVRGTREIVVRPNYVIVYRVLADTVEVLRVLHAAQQWPPTQA